jgi:DNA-directed RNA polymerases I and III subunit RPAC1
MSNFTHYSVKNEIQIPELQTSVSEEPNGKFVQDLTEKLKIEITKYTSTDLEFDLIGVDASIANALRRILLAEVCYSFFQCIHVFSSVNQMLFVLQVPTIAIEHVWIAVNTSIIQDEVLAHRVGLIPIKADARKLDYVIGDEETDKDTIVFHFDVECTTTTVNGQVQVVNGNALSGALKWLPQGGQAEVFPGEYYHLSFWFY